MLQDSGYTPESWAHQLDQRVFFWPGKGDKSKFAASIDADLPTTTLRFDSARFFDRLKDRLWLSPINSGNFSQGGGHVVRGDWLYVSAREPVSRFRRNRIERGHVRTPDKVKELSVLGPISADDLQAMFLN